MGKRRFPWSGGTVSRFGNDGAAYGAPRFREVDGDTRMHVSEDRLYVITGRNSTVELPSVNSVQVGRPYIIVNRGTGVLTVEQSPNDPANSIGGNSNDFDLQPGESGTLQVISTREWMVTAIQVTP